MAAASLCLMEALGERGRRAENDALLLQLEPPPVFSVHSSGYYI